MAAVILLKRTTRVALRVIGLLLLPLLIVSCFTPRPGEASAGDPCQAAVPPEPHPGLTLELWADGLTRPTYLAPAGDGSGRLFVVEQPGTIRVFQGGQLLRQPFLDIRERVSSGGERGLLSVAFPPDHRKNGRLFVNYTRRGDGATVVSRFSVGANPDVADPRSERQVLVIGQPFSNHNGGQLQFGPDGMLYVGMGDGGSGGDPLGNGQDRGTLLGALLRVDVDVEGAGYRIPPDNPFVEEPGAQGEIWAFGLRNPWRFSFDRCDGRLFLADVGQNRWEEVDLIEKGGNYGWDVMEGAHCFEPPTGCDRTGVKLPIAEHGHDLGCSITGGYVYRGVQHPDLVGHYLFGDYCSGRIWSLFQDGAREWIVNPLLDTDLRISSFGEDAEGELYVVDHGGALYRVAAGR